MKVGKPTGAGAVSFNFTPVIDIVFDLLIFFVLTAQFSVLENEDVTLPVSTTGEVKDYSEFNNVVINVVNPDDPAIKVLGDVLSYPELVEMLTDIRKKTQSEGAKLNVILRSDADIPFEKVALVMLAAGNAEIPGWWMQVDISESSKAAEAATK